MEELRMIAMATYQATPEHVQQLALDFFKSMDHDGNRKIDQSEFIEFMKEEGHSRMCNPFFFNQLDLDRNGTLDFDEVMMVYYIIQSGRPFCDRCNRFITSTYFTCVDCLEDPNARPYYLCLTCFRQRFEHRHNDSSRFVDNYSLLEYMTKSKLCELRYRPSASLAAQGNAQPRSRPYASSATQGNPQLRSRPYASLTAQGNPNPGYNQPPPVQNPPVVFNYTSIQNFYCHPSHHVQHPSASNAVINPQPQRLRYRPNASLAALGNPQPRSRPYASLATHPQLWIRIRLGRWKMALDALNVGMYATFMASSFCTIM